MEKEKVIINKRRRKRTKTYKYLKVYFNFLEQDYCVEWREDFFIKKKTETWKINIITKRYYSEVCKKNEYVYSNYEIISPSKVQRLKKLFDKAYEEYIFNIRQKKFKRIVDENN
jgi:hypothetical protein